jgi:hypothetical protein
MRYGGVSQVEMEVTIRLGRADRQAHVCSTWSAWSRQIERLHGSPKNFTARDGKVTSAFRAVPLAAIRIRRPRQSRALTAEERITAVDRLQTAQSSRGRIANTVA